MRTGVLLLFAPGCLLAAGDRPQPKEPPAAPAEAVLFQDLPVVEAASLHAQTLEEAPASVTVISEEDIRKYGYRTLGEALASARGFYMTNDRTYGYVGLRGFLLPGDYNTRFLVMLNGHYLTDNIYSSNGLFGQDFGLDMDLVKRIEIIRGPSSALYGSNGVFATINLVTKSPVDHPLARVSTEIGSFGEKKAQVATSVHLGKGANLLLSGSVFNNRGQDLYFEEFDDPATNHGWARGVDGEKGYHTFANLIWRDWSFTGYFNTREKHVPVVPWISTLFGDRGTKIEDSRNYVEAAYSRDVRGTGKLHWRLYYDNYRFWARYDWQLEDGALQDTRDWALGDWLGSQLSYRFALPRRLGDLTVGGEVNSDLRALQRTATVVPEPKDQVAIDSPDTFYGLFAQHEWELSRHWETYLGLRIDDSRKRRPFVSPRLGLVYQPSATTAYKFLYGRAFRNPNVCELFYDDNGVSQAANPGLRPERADTFEVVMERKLNRRMGLVATGYRYHVGDLIEAVPLWDEVYQYQNLARNRADGLELELNGRPWRGLEAATSLAVQKAIDSDSREDLVNSPRRLGKLRLAAPLAAGKLWWSAAMQYVGARDTLSKVRIAGVPLFDVTVFAPRIHRSLDLRLGIRNLLDRRYDDPAGGALVLDRVRQNGRAFFVKLTWHSAEGSGEAVAAGAARTAAR